MLKEQSNTPVAHLLLLSQDPQLFHLSPMYLCPPDFRLLQGTSYICLLHRFDPVPPHTAPASKQGLIVAGFIIDRSDPAKINIGNICLLANDFEELLCDGTALFSSLVLLDTQVMFSSEEAKWLPSLPHSYNNI